MRPEPVVYDRTRVPPNPDYASRTLTPAIPLDVLGVAVSPLSLNDSVSLIATFLDQGRKGYISVTGMHGVMEATRDPSFKKVLNSSLLVVPDGMPLVWIGKLRGFLRMSRVYGPELMLRICELSLQRGYTHFLCGGAPGVAQELKAALVKKFPGLKVVGTYTPPFGPLSPHQQRELEENIRECSPDIIWVGISTPKQERFMSTYLERFQTTLMFGVGAAFDIHTGRLRDAPDWMKNSGLQWLHRLWQEPRRLFRRYAVNIPLFLFHLCLQSLGRRYS